MFNVQCIDTSVKRPSFKMNIENPFECNIWTNKIFQKSEFYSIASQIYVNMCMCDCGSIRIFIKMHLNLLLLIQRQCKCGNGSKFHILLMFSASHFNVHKCKSVSIQSNRPKWEIQFGNLFIRNFQIKNEWV